MKPCPTAVKMVVAINLFLCLLAGRLSLAMAPVDGKLAGISGLCILGLISLSYALAQGWRIAVVIQKVLMIASWMPAAPIGTLATIYAFRALCSDEAKAYFEAA